MADLLLELFSEEIPARMQADALADLAGLLIEKLEKYGFQTPTITPTNGGIFVTPRRLAVWIQDLPVALADVTTEVKGPKTSAPDAALQGFLKKNNLQKNNLVERDGVY